MPFFKKEKEFQYAPGIEKILEDVQGGGTIVRASLKNALFDGRALDELPPVVIVCKDTASGLYYVLKTATVYEAVAENATTIKVSKNHLFGVGDFVTAGGAYSGASDAITAIDKSNGSYDVITVAGAIGVIAKDVVLVAAKAKAAAGSAEKPFGGDAVITMNKVDLTVANQTSGLLVRGTVNGACMPFPVDNGLKALMPFIRFM